LLKEEKEQIKPKVSRMEEIKSRAETGTEK